MEQLVFTTEMGVVVVVALCFTIVLFVTEIVRIDLAAPLTCQRQGSQKHSSTPSKGCSTRPAMFEVEGGS